MIFYYRAMELARNDEHGQVVFFSSDDTSDKFIMDLACTMAQVDSNRIKDRTAGKDEWDRLEHELMIIESLPLFVDGTPRPTVEHMYFKCAMLNAQKPIKLAGQDYAGLIRVDDAKSERQEAERAFTGVKGIGNTLRFPWVELSQINKGVENRADKWPTPSDLMYAGEAEANVCLTIMRPEHYISRGEDIDCDDKYKTGVALVNVGKNKSGKIGVVPMAFRPEYTRFDDLSFERTDLNNY
jgi:replicative DNA helicase